MVYLLASLLLGGCIFLGANGLAFPQLGQRADEIHARSAWSAGGWSFPPGNNAKVTPGSDLCVIHYLPTNLELFFVADQQPWHMYNSEANPNFVMESLVGFWDLTGLHAYNGVVAITRSSENMEVFYSSDDNTILSRYWTPSGKWKNSGTDKAISSAAGTGIAGVTREQSHMEIFYVGTNNNLMHSYTVDSGGSWDTDVVLAGSEWGTPANKGIAAISRSSQSQEVVWVTTTGAIMTADWDNVNGWGFDALRADGTAHPSSGMAILARSNVGKNIFYIGNDQNVYQGYTLDSNPMIWTFTKLSDLPAAPGSLTAVSMNNQHMEVFWTAPDGTVSHAYWQDSTAAWNSASLTANIYCVPGGSLTAVSRKDGVMDVFCIPQGDDSKILKFSYS